MVSFITVCSSSGGDRHPIL